jgi:deoxyribonuclease-4
MARLKRRRSGTGSRRAPLLGAHQSIAGGLHRALERGRAAGCEAIQLFTRSARQWASRPLAEDEVRTFAAARTATGIDTVLAHDSYLFNVAAPVADLRTRSVRELIAELERCERLGIRYLVAHPGADCGAGEDAGLRTAARSLGEILAACRGFRATIALENTAGQGTQIGWRFEHLGRLFDETREGDRLRVCLDTEHAFAAGYDLRTPSGYESAIAALDAAVGVTQVVAFHLNDAKCGLGGRLDRHEHIGKGGLGLPAFRRVLRDARFAGRPMCIETPKGEDLREDRRNLAVLRSLL